MPDPHLPATVAAAQVPLAPDAVSLEQRLAALETRTDRARVAVERTGERSEDQQRTVLSTTIIYIFVGVVVFGMAILVLRGVMTNEWREVTAEAIDLIKSAVLPVVTLVLGYYFGRSGRG